MEGVTVATPAPTTQLHAVLSALDRSVSRESDSEHFASEKEPSYSFKMSEAVRALQYVYLPRLLITGV